MVSLTAISLSVSLAEPLPSGSVAAAASSCVAAEAAAVVLCEELSPPFWQDVSATVAAIAVKTAINTKYVLLTFAFIINASFGFSPIIHPHP